MVPTCRKADICVCLVGTLGDMLLHNVGDMSLKCRPRHFKSVVWLADKPTSNIFQLRWILDPPQHMPRDWALGNELEGII